MKQILILGLVILLAACQATTPPVVEAPMTVPAQIEAPAEAPAPIETTDAPVVTETPVAAPATETAPTVDTKSPTCAMDCTDDCTVKSLKICPEEMDYSSCVDDCGTALRAEGCKAACAAESKMECEIIFKSECKRECAKSCA